MRTRLRLLGCAAAYLTAAAVAAACADVPTAASPDGVTPRFDNWGWHEVCQSETLTLPAGGGTVFTDDPPFPLYPDAWIVDWYVTDGGYTSYGTACWLEWSNGPLPVLPTLHEQEPTGGTGGWQWNGGFRPRARVSDCNYRMWMDDSTGAIDRDSLMLCQRNFNEFERMVIDSALTFLADTASSAHFPDSTARRECADFFGSLRTALQDTTGFGVGKTNTGHGGQSTSIPLGYAHVDPLRFRNLYLSYYSYGTLSASELRVLARSLVHEAGHGWGGFNHPDTEVYPNYSTPGYRRLNHMQQPNDCIQ